MSSKNYILWLVLGFGFLAVAFVYSAGRSAEIMGEFISINDWGKDDTSLDNADVALISLNGIILDSEDWLSKLKKISDSKVPGVLIRIDSPGGAVGPSQEMYKAVLKLRETKKVYCSFGDLAASGGYYVGSACEKIFTNSGTITGSIGVIMNMMNLKELYNWAKVKPLTIKAGKFKDVGNPARDMQPEERALLQDMIDEVHGQFKDDVQKGRPNLSKETIDKYADGRVFTGSRAVELGFADEVATQSEAVDKFKEALGIDREIKMVNMNKKMSRIEKLLGESYSPGSHWSSSIKTTALSLLGKMNPGFKPELEAGRAYLLPYFWFDAPQAR